LRQYIDIAADDDDEPPTSERQGGELSLEERGELSVLGDCARPRGSLSPA